MERHRNGGKLRFEPIGRTWSNAKNLPSFRLNNGHRRQSDPLLCRGDQYPVGFAVPNGPLEPFESHMLWQTQLDIGRVSVYNFPPHSPTAEMNHRLPYIELIQPPPRPIRPCPRVYIPSGYDPMKVGGRSKHGVIVLWGPERTSSASAGTADPRICKWCRRAPQTSSPPAIITSTSLY